MRIALLPSAYQPHIGGVEELTHRLARRLVEHGDIVEVWTVRHPAWLSAVEVADGIPIRRFAFPLPTSPLKLATFPTGAFETLGALSNAVRDFRPDLLHIQCFSVQGIYAAALAARHRLPLVVSLQGETLMDDAEIYARSLILRLGLRIALRRADAVTGCSAFVLDDAVHRFGLKRGTGRVIHNGVEVTGDAPLWPIDVPFERFVFALGRMVRKKGFDLLVAAFANVAIEHPGVGLVIGGDGPIRADLTAQIRSLGIQSRVILPGRLDRGRVAWAMAHAEIFVLPSRVEPFGIVILEALRAGRPVVVSSRGGASEIIRNGVEGLTADPLDSSAFACAISSLLGDSQMRQRLSAEGGRRAQAFSWELIGEKYAELYRDVVRAHLA